jgi:hypothetical protein
MSHVVSIKTQVRDPAAVAAACRRLGLEQPTQGKAQMYGGQTLEGLLVQLPGWRFPVVINTATGEVKCDNFNGHWGEQEHLDRFLQAYAVEKATLEARKRGHAVKEQTLGDGSVKLTIMEAF